MMNFIAKDDREIRRLCSKLSEREKKVAIAYLRGLTDGREKHVKQEVASR